MNNFYVYEWYIINTDEVFYVGKGKGKRAKERKNNKFFIDMCNTHNCDFRIKIDNLTEEKAFEYEKKLIYYYREYYPEYRLTNQTDGGEGTSGLKHSSEWKEKVSRTQKQKWNDENFRNKIITLRNNDGSPYKSTEFRMKISKIVRGKNNPNYGNEWNEEQKRIMRDKMKNRYNGENNPNYNNRWNEDQKKHLSDFRKNSDYRNENHGMAKRVICLETGEIFGCIKMAKEKYDFVCVISSKYKYIDCHHFKEIDTDYKVNKEELFNELVEFYRSNVKKGCIFICFENKEIVIGKKRIQEITGYSIEKINRELTKNKKIVYENNVYVEVRNL